MKLSLILLYSYGRCDDTGAAQPLYGGYQGKGYQAGKDCAKYLFSRGLRYRVNNRKLPGSPDIVLKKYKTVVFIDGCFWHGHEGCKYYRLPKTNVDFWRHKIAMNIARDYANGVDLRLAGWKVIRVWECDIKTKAKRGEILERLYQEIVGTEHKSNTYESPPDADQIAAEPRAPYGDKKN